MRWAKARGMYKTTWHLVTDPPPTGRYGYSAACDQREGGIPLGTDPELMPEDRRPALGRNNICARCRAQYLKTRPDLQGYFDRLNDTRDV